MAVESDSVQPVPHLRQELFRMMALAADRLRCLGASVDSVDTGFQQVLMAPPPRRAGPSLRPTAVPSPGGGKTGTGFSPPGKRPTVLIPDRGEKLHLVPDEVVY